MKLQPTASRVKIKPLPQGISASMPARKNWVMMALLLVWLYLWGGGEAIVLQAILTGNRLTFMLQWFVLWSIGGFWAICLLLWQLTGREVVTISDSELTHWAGFFCIGRTRRYVLSEVRRLRAVDCAPSQGSSNLPLFGKGTGPIAFDYGARTYYIASSLDEADAYDLVLELSDFIPKNKTS